MRWKQGQICLSFARPFAASFHINPLSPKSDQHQFSPNNTNTLSKEKVMRFNKMIRNSEKML